MKRRDKIAIALLITLLLCLCVFVVPVLNTKAAEMRLHSAYESLKTSLMIQLNSYYDDHGRYPDSLDVLHEIEYADGAKPAMLEDFNYRTDGTSCELSYFSDYYKNELTLSLAKGELKRQADSENSY